MPITAASPYLDLVGLLFAKGGAEYNLIQGYYQDRNRAAHGDWPDESVVVPQIIEQLLLLEAKFPA